MSDTPEKLLADTRTAAQRATDYGLDELIATTDARRNVARAHGRLEFASLLFDMVAVMADVRRERSQLAEAIEDALFPCVDARGLSHGSGTIGSAQEVAPVDVSAPDGPV